MQVHLLSSKSACLGLGRRFQAHSLPVHCRAAKKGFGQATEQPASDEETGMGKQARGGKRIRQRKLQTTMPAPQQEQAFAAVQQMNQELQKMEEDEDFSKRLAALKAEGEARRKESGLPAVQAPVGPSATPATTAAFDADIYANPPSIQDTLMSQLNSDVSDPKLRSAQFGPNQVGIAAGAVIFGLVFVLVSGGDFLPNNRYKGVRAAREYPDAVEEGIIKGRIAQLENALQADANDTEALQALALSYAQLFNFDKAAGLLDKLTAREANNADAWRLLGETTLLGEQARRSVAAYEKAVALRDNDLQIATGLVDAYIANGQYSKAVDYLLELRKKVPEVSALGAKAATSAAASTDSPAAPAAPPAVPSADSSSPAPEAASTDAGASSTPEASTSSSSVSELPVMPAPPVSDASSTGSEPAPSTEASTSGSTAAGADTSPAPASSSSTTVSEKQPIANRVLRPLDPVSVELLLAKTYSQWRGHDSDALATYDALVARFPEDFRGYLAKGVYLRDKGRRADAERMFLQARFFAPENRQRFVKQTMEERPIVDLPSNE